MDLLDYIERNKPRRILYKKDLEPINNLKIIFRDVRDYFAGNITGITRDEKIANNIMYILFCKIYDEKNTPENEIVKFSNRPNESFNEFYSRIIKIFDSVKKQYSDIFQEEENIDISPKDLSFIVSKLESYSLLDADRDVIADAFEELIGKAFRGGEGQFFTPRNVVQMMIDVFQPRKEDKILDPACGSGGFLAHILKYYLKKGITKDSLFGIDKDSFLSKLAKIYLTILGENKYHIFCENSLETPNQWKKETRDYIKLGEFDLILTNPPFGSKIPVVGDNLLKQYELGHLWKKNISNWLLTKQLREKQPPQILFIERVIQLLKNGGCAGIVLPEGIFGNPSDRYIWEFIRKYASIIGIVSLSQETFQPSTHTKTSVVFLEKKVNSRKSVFMSIAKSIGHNKNGKEIYKINKNGTPQLNTNGYKILDDDTVEIAQNFVKFLGGNLSIENHLGFIIPSNEIDQNIYIPEHYNPDIKERYNELKLCGKYELLTINDLRNKDVIQIKRGDEIGSQHYGSGDIPFIRTTDIVNWEIKMDTVKTISEEIYHKYKKRQDIQEKDILFVNDGTFLIGRCSMITKMDIKCVIQSHLKKIRVIESNNMNPYYFFYLLNTNFVQRQIESKIFVQATLSTIGSRFDEIVLPIHVDKEEVTKISNEVRKIINAKMLLRKKSLHLINSSI